MKSNIELLREGLHKHPFLIKKISSFKDFEDVSFFDIKKLVDLLLHKHKKYNDVKIDYNAYSKVSSLISTLSKIISDTSFEINFSILSHIEKIEFLNSYNISFEILKDDSNDDEFLIINPKNYNENKLIGSPSWCVTKSLDFWNRYTHNCKFPFYIICSKNKKSTFLGITKQNNDYICANIHNSEYKPPQIIVDHLGLKENNFDEIIPYVGIYIGFTLLCHIPVFGIICFLFVAIINIKFKFFKFLAFNTLVFIFSQITFSSHFYLSDTLYSSEYFSIANPIFLQPDANQELINELISPDKSDQELINNYYYLKNNFFYVGHFIQKPLVKLYEDKRFVFFKEFIKDNHYHIKSVISLITKNHDLETLNLFIKFGFYDFKLFSGDSNIPYLVETDPSNEFLNILNDNKAFNDRDQVIKILRFSYLHNNTRMIQYFKTKLESFDKEIEEGSLLESELKLMQNLKENSL